MKKQRKKANAIPLSFIDPVHMDENRMSAKSIHRALLTALDDPFELHLFFYIGQPDTFRTIGIYNQ